MGYGDNWPPELRADPFPPSLRSAGGFRLLILTFISWDVIKLTVTAPGVSIYQELSSHAESNDFVFEPAWSGLPYTFVAQGCAKAIDGSTGYCSPLSTPLTVEAAGAANWKSFLLSNGLAPETSLRGAAAWSVSLRALLGLRP
jgi:hypothetical protein